ncbi:putative mitochondrial protein [Cucumis melo var. makuwa]|uniref:Mitochondrial protein n=1 Tax=Cucumis melo var. makuwa TaxID=1194695 RepID=A0A5D3CA14_CUCMM|nr:putative mitochondrial protein [Cucumis melo var. makuwa]TYK08355.1 putative mitochondrial protein [Cucumis melo var. makuwa]
MPSHVLHFQALLDCPKESYPSTRLILDVPLWVFECTAYVHSHGPNQTKFTPRTQARMFVGYHLHKRGSKCFYPSSHKSETNSTNSRTNNKIGENDGSETTVLEDMVSRAVLENLSPQLRAFTANLDYTTIPKNIYLVLECTKWKVVVKEEMRALEKNKTWDLCTLPKRHKTVGCKWVFTLKYRADVLIVYADDIVLSRDDTDEIVQLKKKMGFEFEIKDLRNLKYFLGMEVARFKEGISVSQRKYTLDLLTETSMLGCRPANTPIEFNYKLGNSDDQSMQAPYEEHMKAVNRILRYLKTTPDKGLMFRKTDRKTIEAYTDSN